MRESRIRASAPGLRSEGLASEVEFGESVAANRLDEGFVDVGVGIHVEESEETKREDVSRGEVVVLESALCAEEKRLQPLQLLLHFHPPTLFLRFLHCSSFFHLRTAITSNNHREENGIWWQKYFLFGCVFSI